ncbi:MAG TPA: hypothetical protein VNJ05_09235 [Sphingomicrobium sp.]|nr:hypothetical protein [Sphingomicrobium sp.]
MRAKSSGIRLTSQDAAIVKAMIARGDRQHDIAAWFGVNGGRIGEIASGRAFSHVPAAQSANLPPPGPYPSGREAVVVLQALVGAQKALAGAEMLVRQYLNR